MIRPNFIEVKNAPRHENEEELLAHLASYFKALPGKVLVLCDPHVKQSEGGILMPDGKWEGSQNSDTGTVFSSGYKSYEVGMRVAFLPMEGLRYTHKDNTDIPDGVEIRLYNVSRWMAESRDKEMENYGQTLMVAM